MDKLIRWILIVLASIFYHPLMLLFLLTLMIAPFQLLEEIIDVIKYEIPISGTSTFSVLAVSCIFILIAMSNRVLGLIYRKITMLLPLLQMCVYLTIALQIALLILNRWAETGAYSKGTAIMLAILSIVGIRLLVSFLYWKYPIAVPGAKARDTAQHTSKNYVERWF
ncbi:hypothetical protein ACFP56_11180 [Paenibacillus septentrionalis]|uniref:DUF2569 family protein n=1 Tax=Paenibacillus septentrionalis TaxID=429342 RepID=A0ABW1V330_9BACL